MRPWTEKKQIVNLSEQISVARMEAKERESQWVMRRREVANTVSDHVVKARVEWKWSGRLIKKPPIADLKTRSAPKSALPPLWKHACLWVVVGSVSLAAAVMPRRVPGCCSSGVSCGEWASAGMAWRRGAPLLLRALPLALVLNQTAASTGWG
jgi:hypothetical protein